MAAKLYNPKEVNIVYRGHVIEGPFAADTMVSIAYSEQQFSLAMGAKGGGTRSNTNNLSATITVTLAQSSPSNDVLGDFTLEDVRDSKGIPGSLAVQDASGTGLFNAETAWVQQITPVEYNRETSDRTWVFETDELIPDKIGSNTGP